MLSFSVLETVFMTLNEYILIYFMFNNLKTKNYYVLYLTCGLFAGLCD